MFNKGYIKKILALVLATLSAFSMLSIPVNAASYPDVYMVMGLGRPSVMVLNSGSVNYETMGEISSYKDFVGVPVLYNGSTYVPFRYIMEKAGFVIGWDEITNSITIKRKNEQFNVWSNDGAGKVTKMSTSNIEYSSGVFKVNKDNKDVEPIYISPMVTLFGKTYIPVRELERLGFIIYWEGKYNVIHIAYENNRTFESRFEEIFKETDAGKKTLNTEKYVNSIIKTNKYTEGFEKYISLGTEYNNYSNNALAIKTNDGLFISTLKEIKDSKMKAIGAGSRQLTYCEYGNKKYIYFISNQDKQIYKIQVSGNLRLGSKSKVELPQSLSGKKFSQLIIDSNRMFFLAYDNAVEGGFIYMTKPGIEEKTAVKVTNVRAWNIALTLNNELYYTNMSRGNYLYSVSLKDASVMQQLYENSESGVEGNLVRTSGIQSLAVSRNSENLYYYTDIETGSIMESNNGTVSEVVKAQNGNILMNFLNLKETNKEKALYYIEYPNGKIKDFGLCKIVKYDFNTGKTSDIYISDKMIMQLTVINDEIFFTNETYSALYKITYSNNSYTFSEM